MACIQSIYTCSILLALIACNAILFTEGRPLKAMGKGGYNSIQDEKETRHGTKAINSQTNPGGHRHGYDYPAPHASHVPVTDHSVTGKKDIPPTMTLDQNHGSNDSVALYAADDFRPSTPGNSPGVGHYFDSQKDEVRKNTQNNGGVGDSMEGDTDDFRHTVAGHSPGVGHYFQNTNAEQNP